MTFKLHLDSTICGSKRAINCIAVLPGTDIYHYATSSEDGSVKIWTSSDRVVHGFLPSCFPEPVTALVWRNSKALLAASGTSIYLLTWTASSFVTKTVETTWDVAEDEINAIHVISHKKGDKAVIADDTGRVSILSLENGIVRPLTSSMEHAQICSCLCTTSLADHVVLASGGLDCRIKLWDVSTSTLMQDIDVATERQADESAVQLVNPPYVNALHALDKGRIVAGLGDGSVLFATPTKLGKRRAWSINSVQTHRSGIGAITSLCVDAQRFVVTGSNDKTCKLWRLDEMVSDQGCSYTPETSEASLAMPGKVNAMATLPDGRVIVGDVLGNLTFLRVSSHAEEG